MNTKQTGAVATQPQPHSKTLTTMGLASGELAIMGSIKNLDAFVEQHETVVAFLVPLLALLATFFLIALVCRSQGYV